MQRFGEKELDNFAHVHRKHNESCTEDVRGKRERRGEWGWGVLGGGGGQNKSQMMMLLMPLLSLCRTFFYVGDVGDPVVRFHVLVGIQGRAI